MTPKSPQKSGRQPGALDRRSQHALREALDELVQHVRVIARTMPTMAPHEIDYAQHRLEWLADEVWRIAVGTEPAD
ncbi:MAG: hypothetical protein OER21_00855 [Gemmatimonadota bacterium]|nr:hypothetical protein [Gemmatimonadota bacterium]